MVQVLAAIIILLTTAIGWVAIALAAREAWKQHKQARRFRGAVSELHRETVIIVHGTWAAPKRDRKAWYELPTADETLSNFATKLNAALMKRGSLARCWAHCTSATPIFSWSGANDWVERARG